MPAPSSSFPTTAIFSINWPARSGNCAGANCSVTAATTTITWPSAQAAEVQQLAAYKNQQREIAHLMEFVERFRAKASKASQAQSKLKQVERMEKIEAPGSGDASQSNSTFRNPGAAA